MPNPPLVITAKCRHNDQCIFDGKDLFLDVSITNPQKIEIGFPLAFVQKTGPIIRLIDTKTKTEEHLKTNLADLDLREKFTMIKPGKSVTIEWVITAGELRQFGGYDVDVTAEITVKTGIQVDGKRVDFRCTDTLHISSPSTRPK